MADNKDFLEQFSSKGKPDSFREEERVPVTKDRKPLNKKVLIVIILFLLALLAGLYFLFLAPKIEMPDFLGRTKNDVAAWVKQQEIEPSGIIFEEVYDFDTEEGTILSQSVEAGKKVKENVKLDFTVSLGADPDESIRVPDVGSMSKEEIQNWIAANKLQKTKISTSYNEEVEENQVIDYSFSGCEEDSFTRACSLKINISKGPAPAGKVTVEDFVNKPYDTAESWAKSKKVTLNKSYAYSEKVEEDFIISQSIEAGKTINEGDSITVVVSKGKAVYMPNMIGWSEEQCNKWCGRNGVSADVKESYSGSSKGTIIGQNIESGKLINSDSYIVVTVSLGNTVDFAGAYDLDSINAILDEANSKGANIKLKINKEFSDYYDVGAVITSDKKVNVGGTLNVTISRGRNILLQDDSASSWNILRDNPLAYMEDDIRSLCTANGATCVFKYENSDKTTENGRVVEAYRSDKETLATGTYCPQDVTITIVINDESR